MSSYTAELEFLAAEEGDNLEHRMALLDKPVDAPIEQDVSLRLLRHYASSVHHRQYHDMDILTVHVTKHLRNPRG